MLFQLSSSATWLGLPQILSLPMFLKNYLVHLLIIPSAWSACYLLWVHGLGLRYPMPFTGLGGYVLAMVVTFINIICSFPDRWQQSESFKKKRKFFISVIMYTFFTYFFLEWAFTMINPSYQWILAFSLPLIREGHIYVFGILCTKSAGGQVLSMLLILIQKMFYIGYFY